VNLSQLRHLKDKSRKCQEKVGETAKDVVDLRGGKLDQILGEAFAP
jgi:hypothetical protein